MDAGRYPEAIAWLEASVELEPSDLHVRNQLALCYLNAENLDSAVTSYEGDAPAGPEPSRESALSG